MRFGLALLLAWITLICPAQDDVGEKISNLESQKDRMQEEIKELNARLDSLKLVSIGNRLAEMGLPGETGELVKHQAMFLSYAEEHEQAYWVAHIISKDVAKGRTTRSNDFRQDPLVSTGSAEEADYFLKSKKTDGDWEYDGYGYDRGHLAPSADFRWNQTALSESYFYSNMTPQHPDFNRGAWAELESYIRGYAIENNVDVFVVTGPVLNENLSKVERSINGLTLPEYHFKVAIDPLNAQAIGFLMPNEKCELPLEAYAKSIDEIEELTGLDFFNGLEDNMEMAIEKSADYRPWLPEEQREDALMLSPDKLGKGRYNTLQAYEFADKSKKVTVCGTVVSTFRSAKDNVFVNLDKKFPNTIFTLTIWSRNVTNFSYAPEKELMNQRVCARGEITLREGVMQMNLTNEKELEFLEGDF